jgi:hypothetical protein
MRRCEGDEGTVQVVPKYCSAEVTLLHGVRSGADFMHPELVTKQQ